jgi:hypothetical protein
VISGSRTSTGRGDLRFTSFIEHDRSNNVNRPRHRTANVNRFNLRDQFVAKANDNLLTPFDLNWAGKYTDDERCAKTETGRLEELQ